MRSSKRSDLDVVRAQFKAWREGPRSRAIPDNLWRAAVKLMNFYGASTVCRRLGLNPSRFKQMREALGGSVVEECRSPRGRGEARPPQFVGRRGRSQRRQRAADLARQSFVEMPPLGFSVHPSLGSSVSLDTQGPAECRLVVDTAGGARLTVILARAEVAVIDALCRSLLGGPKFSGQAGM